MEVIQLKHEWEIGERLGSGGFGEVFLVSDGEVQRALKLVPKAPGAERELLFVDLGDARNVVPILDVGEMDGAWALLMPLAECSLRDKLVPNSPAPFSMTLAVLKGVFAAISDLSDKVVHRDIKPENILLVDGEWCLADFGISRYAEATTDAATKKYAFTPAYCAPERWRHERATSASDIYSIGVLMHELLTGAPPFPGPSSEEYCEQHLQGQVPLIEGAEPGMVAMCVQCLYKAPGARPSASDLLARLSRIEEPSASQSRAKLASANLIEVQRQAEGSRQRSRATSEAAGRAELYQAAVASYPNVISSLLDVVEKEAPVAKLFRGKDPAARVIIGDAVLSISSIRRTLDDPWNWDAPDFDVIAHASIQLAIPVDHYGYDGRSHSLWYCDAVESDFFAWYETAFMSNTFARDHSPTNPFALPPGEKSAKALWTGIAEYSLAWPFERLEPNSPEEFVKRWTGWLADAATGRLQYPSRMPEKNPSGSWRKA